MRLRAYLQQIITVIILYLLEITPALGHVQHAKVFAECFLFKSQGQDNLNMWWVIQLEEWRVFLIFYVTKSINKDKQLMHTYEK